MKEMTIEESHEVALDIMKEIHEFCMLNGIHYSLAYGSLIGAMRHQGFIPWDDDIDIWMTRDNFEKFTRSFVSKKGYRLSSIYDEDSLINFDRVYEIQKTYVKHGIISCKGRTGIWVDIMPLDGVPDDESLRLEQYDEFKKLIRKMINYRAWMNFLRHGGSKSRIKMFIKNLIMDGLSQFTTKEAKEMHKEMVRLSKQYTFKPSKYCCYFQCGDAYRKGKQELLLCKSFNDYKLTKFEDTEFMIVKDYDSLLTGIYGDYMKLPPEEARHKSHGVCFWL